MEKIKGILLGLGLGLISIPALGATILPQGQTQFLDTNGAPLAGGKVYFYVPGTTTLKNTWSDAAQANLNTNPVGLDLGGRAKIYGSGCYQELVQDTNGFQIWSSPTCDTSGGSGGGSVWGGTSTGSPNVQIVGGASAFTPSDGAGISWRAGFTNTGPATLTPGGGSPLSVVFDSPTGPVALTGGEIVSGNLSEAVYFSTDGKLHLVTSHGILAPGGGGTGLSTYGPITGQIRALAANTNLLNADKGKTIVLQGGSQFQYSLNAPGTGYDPDFQIRFINTTLRGQTIAPSGLGSFILWPGASSACQVTGAVWFCSGTNSRYAKVGVNLFVDGTGNNANDCLAGGTAACQTIGGAITRLYDNIDAQNSPPTIHVANGIYGESVNFSGQITGYNFFQIVGANVGGVTIRPAGGTGSCAIFSQDGAEVQVQNLKLDNVGGSSGASGLCVHQSAVIDVLSGMEFGNFGGGYHMLTDNNSMLNINASYAISGSAAVHIQAGPATTVTHAGGITVTITNSPVFTDFIVLTGARMTMGGGVSYVGTPTAGCTQWGVSFFGALSTSSNTIPCSNGGSPVRGAGASANGGLVQ